MNKLTVTIKCLMQNKLRFLLTVTSVSVAVSSVLLIKSVSDFGTKSIWNELDSLGMNGLIVTSQNGSFDDKDVNTIKSIRGISKTAPVTMDSSKVIKDSRTINAIVWGIDSNAQDVVSFELVSGRFINKSDINSNNKVCMIDKSLAENLFGSQNALGRSIEVQCKSTSDNFNIVGVVKTGKGIMQSLMGNYIPGFLYAPYTAVHESDDFTQVFLKTESEIPIDSITKNVKQNLGDKANISDLASQKETLQNMLGTVTLILTAIGGISLFVSGMSIMNIMLISVNERKREIGIKKSIGASSIDIMLDFLLESVIISLSGTLTGILIAFCLIFIANNILNIEISLKLGAIFLAMMMAVSFGGVFGIFPAYKASKLVPAKALRKM